MSGYAPGSIRIWDGTRWRYAPTDWVNPLVETIKVGASTALISTTTTVSRTPSTARAGDLITVTGSTSGRNGGNLEFFCSNDSQPWTKFATATAPTGGGNVNVAHRISITNTLYYVGFTGSSTHEKSVSPSSAAVPMTTKKTATKAIDLSWVQAYDGKDRKILGSSHDAAIHQGYYSATFGNRKSLLRFVPGLPSDAEVSKVLLKCTAGWASWSDSAGGTLVVGSFAGTPDAPTAWPASAVTVNRTRKQVGSSANAQTWVVDLTSWADIIVQRSDFSGLTVGPGPTTSSEFYGYSVDAPVGKFTLEITYSSWS
jgi:hypothetical protein